MKCDKIKFIYKTCEKRMLFSTFLVLFVLKIFGQSSNYGKVSYRQNNPLKKYPAVGLGTAGNLFFGDNGSVEKGNLDMAFQIKADYRFCWSFGIDYTIAYGHLGQQYKKPYQLYDFKLNYFNSCVILRYHLDDFIGVSYFSPVSPFIAAGFGIMHFESYRNLFDNQNKPYKIAQNGVVTDYSGQPNERDDVFESRINGIYSLIDVYCLGGGLKYKLDEHLEFCTDLYFYYTGYDHLEGHLSYVKDDSGNWKRKKANHFNDAFIQASITVLYCFGFNPNNRAKRKIPPVQGHKL